MATSTGAPLSTNKPEGGDVASTAIKTTIAAAIQAINDYVALDCKNTLTTAGDTVYASAAKTLARLAKGTARQQLAMNSGATAPEWVASLQSLLTAEGDVLYASAANTPARLAKGTANQLLRMNSGATAPEWASTLAGLTLTTPTIGDFTNAQHAHAAAGSGGQLDHGAALTGLTDDDHTQYQLKSLLTTQGDIPYATAASTWARLAKGTAKQLLAMNAGETAPEWVSADNSYLANRTRNLWMASGAFIPRAGSPVNTLCGANTRYNAWAFDSAADETITGTIELPEDYVSGQITVKLHWTNLGAGSGNVYWQAGCLAVADTGDLNATTETNGLNAIAAPAQNVKKVSTSSLAITPAAATALRFTITRLGADGNDTLGNDAGLVGLEIEYTADM